ncbi:MAG: MFS transporter [Gammaproteobacteria bacterium]|nr:MFS transporter [Gammaproteobacteria bacterium]
MTMQRYLARLARVEPRETAAVVAAFCLFFFVLGSSFAVRPVRETVATLLGRERVADLWLYTALFSIAIVPLWGWLVARMRRSLLLPLLYGSVAIILAIIGTSIQVDESNLRVGTFFYVWISVINLMLVSVFWSFLLEMFDSEQAERLFGFIAAGGTLGALVGPLTARLTVDTIGNSGVLYLGTVGFLSTIFCQRTLIKIWKRKPLSGAPLSASGACDDESLGGNPFAGIFIVLHSPYLLGIALFVVFLSAVNTFVYFEQLRIVSETFSDTTRRTEVFANIDFIVQAMTILSQVFLTGRIASKLGVRTLLTFVPVLMILGFILLSMFTIFGMVAALLILRRWGEYAFVRPGREMLWGAMDKESKYKAKSFVDVPVYRVADYVGAQAKTALDAVSASPAGAAFVGAALAAGWAVNGWWLGRRHDRTAVLNDAKEPRESK